MTSAASPDPVDGGAPDAAGTSDGGAPDAVGTRDTPADTLLAAGGDIRSRLLHGLATSIVEKGYKDSTVADVVRIARTSRREFYAQFDSRDTCYVALLNAVNGLLIARIAAAVDSGAPWRTQARQAIDAWIAGSDAHPEITLSWIRDSPGLGEASRTLQREAMQAFVTLVQQLASGPSVREDGLEPMPGTLAVVLIGGLRELIARQVEDGRPIAEIADAAYAAAVALVGATPARD